ncbi:hypothetical protein K525DRAFT_227335 [Schizophyllum commune Loenen D]|nr:hypothetical protein K525DRAFT_227335 [Schizophyllum commune Loenen D]
MSSRPQTSKPRGVCAYYKEPRGCFAGSRCKFLHGEPGQEGAPTITPFDAAKTCRFYANGYCRRGDSCWFKHVKLASSQVTLEDAVEDDPCSICFEKPTTYGLLGGCSHVFCLECLRQWRDPTGKTEDLVQSRAHKKCPMCRAKSAFITPSSVFIKHGDPAKDKVIQAYKESMAKRPCRHFQESKSRPGGQPHCPFGRDCFYQHLNDDGTPYVFPAGYRPHRSNPRMTFGHPAFMDGTLLTSSLDILDGILSDPAIGSLADNAPRALEALRAGVQRLGNAMFGGALHDLPLEITNTLSAAEWDLNVAAAPGEGYDVEVGNFMHELVTNAARRRTQDRPPRPVEATTPRPAPAGNPVENDGDDGDNDSMPELQSVSNSSASEGDGSDAETDEEHSTDGSEFEVPSADGRFPSPWGQVRDGGAPEHPRDAAAAEAVAALFGPGSRFATTVLRGPSSSQNVVRTPDSESEDEMPPLEPVDLPAATTASAGPSSEPSSSRTPASSSPPLPTEFTTNGQGRVVFSGPEPKPSSIPFTGLSDNDSEDDDMPVLEPAIGSSRPDSPMPALDAVTSPMGGPSTGGIPAPSSESLPSLSSSPPLPTEFVTDGQGRIVYSGSEGGATARTILGRMYNTLFPTSNL